MVVGRHSYYSVETEIFDKRRVVHGYSKLDVFDMDCPVARIANVDVIDVVLGVKRAADVACHLRLVRFLGSLREMGLIMELVFLGT